MTAVAMVKTTTPEPGFFRCRLLKSTPWVAARVVRRQSQPDRSPVLVCMVAGDELDVEKMWPWLDPVDEAEYLRLLATMPADPRRAFRPEADIPDFGQGAGHNSRDAELVAAARNVRDWNEVEPDRTEAEKVAQLAKAIIAERDHLANECREAQKPLKAQLDAIKREHECAAEEYRPRLLGWLARWMELNDAEKVQASGATAHWRTTQAVEIVDAAKVPLRFRKSVVDEAAVLEELKAGRKVHGCYLKTDRVVRVV